MPMKKSESSMAHSSPWVNLDAGCIVIVYDLSYTQIHNTKIQYTKSYLHKTIYTLTFY